MIFNRSDIEQLTPREIHVKFLEYEERGATIEKYGNLGAIASAGSGLLLQMTEYQTESVAMFGAAAACVIGSVLARANQKNARNSANFIAENEFAKAYRTEVAIPYWTMDALDEDRQDAIRQAVDRNKED